MSTLRVMGLLCLCLLLLSTRALAERMGKVDSTGSSTQAQQVEQESERGESEDEDADSAVKADDAQPGFGCEYSVTFASDYVWRGLLLTDGPALQPSFTISQEQLSLNLWGNMDLSNVKGFGGELSEVDLTLDYTCETGRHAISIGVAHYGFPHTGAAGTSEVYASIAGGGLLNPEAALWYDFGETKGTYLDCSISHSFPVAHERTLELSAGVGWGDAANNEACYGVHSSAFCDLQISVEAPIETSRGFCITPALSYSRVLGGKLRKAASPDDLFAFSLTLSFEH